MVSLVGPSAADWIGDDRLVTDVLPTAPPTEPTTGSRAPRRGEPQRALVPVLVGLLAAAVYAVHLDRPSPWRDEVATLDAARRSPAGIFALTSRVDAVHAAYYQLTAAVADLDPGPVRVLDGRLISLVALAVAAAGTVLIGRRTDSARSGLLAGLFLAGSPLTSRFAAEARPFALATALAVVSTLALLKVLARPGPARWVGYATALVLLAAVEILALPLVVAVHAVHVLTAARPSLRRWATAVGVAVAAVSPLAVEVIRQRGQIGSLATPSVRQLAAYGVSAAGSPVGVVALAVAGALAVALAGRRRRRRTTGERRLVPALRAASRGGAGWLLPVAWGLGLPVLVWLVSQVDPLFRDRYVLFTLPGLALLVGRVLARLPTVAAAVALVAVVATGLPTQAAIRGPGGHGEDIRALDSTVAAVRRPGDAVVFVPRSTTRVTQLDPTVWAGLPDLTGDPGRPARRILLVRRGSAAQGSGAADRATLAAVERRRRAADTRSVTGFTVTVYQPR